MKAFDRTIAVVVLILAAILVAANVLVGSSAPEQTDGRPYRVEIERAAGDIERTGSIDLSPYPSITGIEEIQGEFDDKLLAVDSDYVIKKIGGRLYRFDYTVQAADGSKSLLLIMNVSLLSAAVVIIAVMLFVRHRLIRPFVRLRELPYELSKGNLTAPLTENRQRFFGRFVWGMDMLRSKLEQQKAEELSLLSEKKRLLLSISHDIKIPLSAIKLYSRALSSGLYTEPDKLKETAVSIGAKADEIEGFVARMIKASGEDVLQFSVNNGEFYLSGLTGDITEYYAAKLSLLGTEFTVDKVSDCLLKGDPERAVEVLQNIIENAIKYGDGRYIRISFSEEENCRLVTLTNSGCTLPQNELPHIFDSFWRGSNAAEGTGSGLGMYICRGLMNKMGGEVFAEIEGDEMRVSVVFCKA